MCKDQFPEIIKEMFQHLDLSQCSDFGLPSVCRVVPPTNSHWKSSKSALNDAIQSISMYLLPFTQVGNIQFSPVCI